jgi:chromate transporter
MFNVLLARADWSIQDGLASVSVGLLLAGTLSMAKGAVTGWTTGSIALSVLLIMLWRKINPALLVLGGAVVGSRKTSALTKDQRDPLD